MALADGEKMGKGRQVASAALAPREDGMVDPVVGQVLAVLEVLEEEALWAGGEEAEEMGRQATEGWQATEGKARVGGCALPPTSEA